MVTAINNSKSFDTSQIASSMICRIAFSHPFEEIDTLCKREQERDQKEWMGEKDVKLKKKCYNREKKYWVLQLPTIVSKCKTDENC